MAVCYSVYVNFGCLFLVGWHLVVILGPPFYHRRLMAFPCEVALSCQLAMYMRKAVNCLLNGRVAEDNLENCKWLGNCLTVEKLVNSYGKHFRHNLNYSACSQIILRRI